MLALLGVAAVANAGFAAPAEEPDRTALLQYCLLVVGLGAMAQIAVQAISR